MSHSAAYVRSLAIGFLSLALPFSTSSIGGTEPAGPMGTARYGHVAVGLADGRALVAGGYTPQGLTSSAEFYDPSSGAFSPAGSLAEARGGAAAARLPDGRVLVVGGAGLGDATNGTLPLASAEIFDPATGTWTPAGPMATARRSPVALALPGGAVLVMGGDPTTADCELFDPATGTFTATGSFTAARVDFAASVLQDGRVLVAGGYRFPGTYLASAELWDPATGAWSATGFMTSIRTAASATMLGNGKVLLAGGTTDGTPGSAVAAAELYDPATETFSVSGSLGTPRSGHAAVLLGDGNVVVSGGVSGFNQSATASLERYDAVAGTWQGAGSMSTSRRRHSASLLAGGNVLIAGGYDASSNTLATAEIVNPVCVSALPAISPASASFTSNGGTGSLSVTHAPGCTWKVTGQDFTAWLTITSGAQGTGSGTVSYSVAANPDATTRTVGLTIAEQAFSVTQSANPCGSATLSPASQSFSWPATGGLVSLTALSSCSWTVTGVPSWITILSGGTGSANIGYSIAQNTGGARVAALSIANRNLVVSQGANPCFPGATISPTSRSVAASGGTTTVSITTGFSCSWSSSGLPSWITMSQNSGLGSATPTITVAANPTIVERSATFNVAGNNFTLTQAGNPCVTATVTPTSQAVANTGGTGTISLAASSSCAWTVTGMPSWITITSGGSGTGDATIAYSVGANSSTSAGRGAVLSVAGKSFTVNQAAGACFPLPSIFTTSGAFTAAGTSMNTGNPAGSVNVTAQPGCPWDLAQVPAWVSITTPMPAAGSGILTYTVTQNSGAARSASFFIGPSAVYAVSQSAPGAATLPAGRMSTTRDYHAATVLADGRILVSGGYSGSGGIFDMIASAEIYDPATGAFSPTGALIEARGEHAAARLADGRVLVVGGLGLIGGQAVVLASAEIYDPATGTWTAAGPMSTSRRSPIALALPDGRVLVTGGLSGVSWNASSEIFDPATGTFTATGSLLTPRGGPAAAVLGDGRVLLAGGYLGEGPYVATAEIWDPASGAWSATGSMSSARGGASATTLANGMVLIAGGYSGTSFPAAAELYDPATGTFSVTGSLNVPRNSHVAVRLADGSVIITGGGNFSPVGGIERYNPAAGTWQLAGQLSDARNAHSASLLTNGKVLVAGGSGQLGPLLASAESFDPAVCAAGATVSPASPSFASNGGSGSVSISMQAGCPRIVVNVPAWISITSGSSGSGSGTVTYSVAANTGAARSATLTIASRSFAVTQAAAGADPCVFVGALAAGGTSSGTLATSDCTLGARGTSYYTDRYSFTGAPGQQVAFQLSSSAFDTYLYLRNPSGTVIASNDDGGGGTNSRIPAASGVFTLPAGVSGTYVIEVTSFSQRATGAYTLLRIQ